VLILDDFSSDQVPYRELLIWCDVYKHRVQAKGAFLMASWRVVFITCNARTQDWYSTIHGTDREPLDRRLDHILNAPPEGSYMHDSYDVGTDLPGRQPPAPRANLANGVGEILVSDSDDESSQVSGRSYGMAGFQAYRHEEDYNGFPDYLSYPSDHPPFSL